MIIDPKDYKYFIDKPNSSFSPSKNKAIINETIKETERFFEEIANEIDEELGNRIDILASYGTYRFNRGQKSFEDYAGKKIVGEMVGEKILSRIRVMDSVNRVNGNDKYKKFILT